MQSSKESPYAFNPKSLMSEGAENNPNYDWQKTLFEIYLSRSDVIAEHGLAECTYDKPNDIKAYTDLSNEKKAALEADFIKQQTQSEVDQKAAYDDKLLGSIDFLSCNKKQGYFSLRGFTDIPWVLSVFEREKSWKKKEKISEKWNSKVPGIVGLCMAMAHMRLHLPAVVYAFNGLFVAYMFFLFAKWAKHVFLEGGLATWWTDISVERTFPGGVRYFSIDYWSMVCAVYVWAIFDYTGGTKMLFMVLTSAGPQLVLAVHCTLSSPSPSVLLGLLYLCLGVAWVLLWVPSQKAWLNGADYGPTYNGRMGLGCHNPNISFMTWSIMIVGVPLLVEFCCFLLHPSGLNLGWWYLLALYPTGYLTIRHIVLACYVFMSLAKFTATPARVGFDEYGLCTGW